ncbi:hypothetical protein N44_01563 [Microcystis aeruginosa NIES-44]|jgi:hypothetical protein|uniref:Mobile element protein n=1 Tax=Microcystis aeruginosa NIES-44 TaxID=449439 RepID=A0A0A1VUD2_MICAE|nr:hypothetical protein N44_01563 [Microcystis aeruginosa NIES-44]
MVSMPEDTALTPSQIEDLRFAAKKMTGASRRAFQGRICQKYFEGNARKTEKILGWGLPSSPMGIRRTKKRNNMCWATVNS